MPACLIWRKAMGQLIYSVLGLFVAVLFSTSLNSAVRVNQNRNFTNEVLSQMLGIGEDILSDVGRRGLPFDEKVDEERYEGQVQYPLVHVAWELTPSGSFGGCDAPENCLDLDDFHGMKLDRIVEGLEYDIEIAVVYVNEADPEIESAVQTFAKKVTVTISSEAIYVRDEPLTISYARVFAYEQATYETPSVL
jgi:hypothetical protein